MSWTVLVRVDRVGIRYIVQHLTSISYYGPVAPENVEMVQCVEEDVVSGARSGGLVGYWIGADAAFYAHELTEASLVAVGISQGIAQSLPFAAYGMDPRAVNAPQVVAAHPGLFNSPWFDFRGPAAEHRLGSALPITGE